MDELEFRRRIYADPETTDSDVVKRQKRMKKSAISGMSKRN